ncbi:MAG: ABC transporter substrate-binding protein [Chloroflexota bacterium]|nr:ABC transporter substrate-binding protein [Chloroflexota bacterium]
MPRSDAATLSRRHFLVAAAGTASAALLAACGSSSSATDTPKPAATAPTAAVPTTASAVSTTAPAVATTAPTKAPAIISPTTTGVAASGTTAASSATTSSAALGSGPINGMTWGQIVAKAKGGTANWFLYGGGQTTNDYVDKFVTPRMKEQFGINVKRVPVTATVDAVNKVLAEKQAGKTSDGSVDMIWINGENFRTMAEANILFGGWSKALPNAIYIPWNQPSVANDFGYPVNEREAPWGKAQFVMIYDSAKVQNPPTSFKTLEAWMKANPGMFAYAAPPDFTGSVFVRHVFYEMTGGWQQFDGSFNEQLYTEKAPATWDYLNRIKPYLWQKGATYPESQPKLDQLFADDEVSFTMSYNTNAASQAITMGTYPKTVRSYLLDAGTIANTHYQAIPFNAANKEAALVLANFLESPAAQIEKAKVEVWGDAPVVDPNTLPPADKVALLALPRGAATLPDATLAAKAVPELQATYLLRIDKDWMANVLKK